MEELEEAEEWGRADLESMERVDFMEIKEYSRAMKTIVRPSSLLIPLLQEAKE